LAPHLLSDPFFQFSIISGDVLLGSQSFVYCLFDDRFCNVDTDFLGINYVWQ
jgi:hypothetical protein